MIGRIVSIVLLIGSSSFAQSGGGTPHQVIPQPSPELQELTKAIAGKWSVSYQLEADESGKGGEAHGEQVWRTGPGGFTLMEEEHFSLPSREVFLFALMWWDKSANKLRGMLCNNSGPQTCNVDTYANSTLSWDGARLVIDLKFPQGNKNMIWHEVFSDFTANSFTQTGDIGEQGGPLKRSVTIHARRSPEAQGISR